MTIVVNFLTSVECVEEIVALAGIVSELQMEMLKEMSVAYVTQIHQTMMIHVETVQGLQMEMQN